jgi:hypothetical protein
MIRTRFAVDGALYSKDYGPSTYAKIVDQWQQQDFVKFLYENGEIVDTDAYQMMPEYCTVHVTMWKLSETKETFARLKWPEELDKIFT